MSAVITRELIKEVTLGIETFTTDWVNVDTLPDVSIQVQFDGTLVGSIVAEVTNYPQADRFPTRATASANSASFTAPAGAPADEEVSFSTNAAFVRLVVTISGGAGDFNAWINAKGSR